MKDKDGSISSKRIVVLLSFVLIIIGFIGALFFDLTVDEFMFEAIMYIVIAGLGIVGAEKFSKNNNKIN